MDIGGGYGRQNVAKTIVYSTSQYLRKKEVWVQFKMSVNSTPLANIMRKRAY